jgi:RNA polymerase sigma factor (sigma-70 family)
MRPIFNAAYRILHHREDATDVTQTVFLRAYEHFDRFDPSQRFFSWIYRIAVNEAIDMSNGRRPAESVVDDLPSDRSGPERNAESDQMDEGNAERVDGPACRLPHPGRAQARAGLQLRGNLGHPRVPGEDRQIAPFHRAPGLAPGARIQGPGMNSIDPRTLELIHAELDDELDPAAREELFARLAADAEAREARDQMQRMAQSLARLAPVEPPVGPAGGGSPNLPSPRRFGIPDGRVGCGRRWRSRQAACWPRWPWAWAISVARR